MRLIVESLDWNKDRAAAEASFARSKRHAEDALAPKFRDDPGYGSAVYHARIALGAHALRAGGQRAGVRYLLDAVKAPPSRGLEA